MLTFMAAKTINMATAARVTHTLKEKQQQQLYKMATKQITSKTK